MTEQSLPKVWPIIAMQVRVSKWPGKTKLQAEDIGLEEDDLAENVELGSRKLYPDEWKTKFNNITGQAMRYLKKHSLPFILESVRAVPRMRIGKITENLEAFKTKYMETVEEFISELDNIKLEMKEKNPDTFDESDIPSAESLRKKFKMWWAIFEVSGPKIRELDQEDMVEAFEKAQSELNEKMASFVEESVKLLRHKIHQTVTNLKGRLEGGKIIKNTTLDSVRGIHEWFKELNVFGDKDIDLALDKLKASLPEDAAYFKGNQALVNEVSALADQVAQKANQLDDLGDIKAKYVRIAEMD